MDVILLSVAHCRALQKIFTRDGAHVRLYEQPNAQTEFKIKKTDSLEESCGEGGDIDFSSLKQYNTQSRISIEISK